MIELRSVYKSKDYVRILYTLLAERTPDESISHKVMPSYPDHEAFVASRPYACWYMVLLDDVAIGSVYLSKNREIGISIAEPYRGRGYGKEAVKLLMQRWPGRFLANINPKNDRSIKFFEGFGFDLIQSTYEWRG